MLAAAPVLALAALSSVPVRAQGDDSRIRSLELRVKELEEQNRVILEMLRGLGADARAMPATLTLAPGPVAAAIAPAAPQGTPAVAPPPDLPPPEAVTTRRGSKLRFYGQVRLDAVYDDSRTDNVQLPTRVLSEDPSLGGDNGDQFSLHPRLTRVDLAYDHGEIAALGGAHLTGLLEFDFQNGGRESRAVPRYRHAYLQLGWDRSALLLGQTWDIISPLYPAANADTLMWNAGNLGDRRAQVRYSWRDADGGLELQAGVGLTGAIDAQDLDVDGVRDGEAAGAPHLQARLGYRGGRGDRPWQLGLWGHLGREETEMPVAGERSFSTSSLGLDYVVPLGRALSLRGEAFTGRNLDDFRGGIGQGIDLRSGREIESEGGWVELEVRAGSYSLYPGVTVEDAAGDDIAPGGRTRNRSYYLVQRYRPHPSYLVGFDYIRWITDYAGLDRGTDNRFNLYVVYEF